MRQVGLTISLSSGGACKGGEIEDCRFASPPLKLKLPCMAEDVSQEVQIKGIKWGRKSIPSVL